MVMQEDKENKPTSLHLANDIHSLRALHLTFSLLRMHTMWCCAVTRSGDIISVSINMKDRLIEEKIVIRQHRTHTATDSCNQQKKEEGDSRGQLVSSDKAFCITSD